MSSLVFRDSCAGRSTVAVRRVTWALGLLAALACGGDDEGDGTAVLADSGTFSAVTGSTFSIPTAVAVRDDIAWVVESQFDRYPPFANPATPPTPPAAFRIVGVPLPASGLTDVKTITLPENFFPEGITVSPADRMYVGSVATGAIYTVAPGAEQATEFVPPQALAKPSVLGMAVGNNNDILWVCNNVTSGGPAESDIVGIGAGDRQVKATHPLPATAGVGAFCNDIVIAANGTLWATESFGGRIFRIPPGELPSNTQATAWLQATELAGPNGPAAGAFGVNGIALVAGKLFLVNSSRGQLLSIDPTLAQPGSADLRVVALSEAGTPGKLLVTPDGMTRVSDTELLVVENGFGAEGGKRLVRINMDTL